MNRIELRPCPDELRAIFFDARLHHTRRPIFRNKFHDVVKCLVRAVEIGFTVQFQTMFENRVVGQFESSRPTISSIFQTWSVIPASIAGVTRSV